MKVAFDSTEKRKGVASLLALSVNGRLLSFLGGFVKVPSSQLLTVRLCFSWVCFRASVQAVYSGSDSKEQDWRE